MAVTKRTRFEVLRRDEHTCQYCGAKAPDVALQIDHVMPVSLGGDDKPGNLVTACKDCNAGKASITPGSPLVEGLSDRAAAYALGMVDKMTRFRADLESREEYEDSFHEVWDSWKLSSTEKPLPLPGDYKMSLFNWKQMGVPADVFGLIIPVAHGKRNRGEGLRDDGVFRYMAGVLMKMLEQRTVDLSVAEGSAAVYTQYEADNKGVEGYEIGMRKGREDAENHAIVTDPLRNHIDQTEPEMDAWSNGTEYFTGRVVRVGEGSRKTPD